MSRSTAVRRLTAAALVIARADGGAGAARANALLPSARPPTAWNGPSSTSPPSWRASEARTFASSSQTSEGRTDEPSTSASPRSLPAQPSPLPTPAPESGEAGGVLTYVGPLATTVVRLKRLSLASCCLTTAAAPALAGLQATGAADTPAGAAAQLGIAAAIASFGVGTTGLVHWFTKPYVLSLAARTADLRRMQDAAVAVTRMDYIGRRVTVPVRLSSVRPPTGTVHPQVSFADGDDGNRLYYVDADHWPATSAASARLLAVLTPADEGEGVVEGGGTPAQAAGKREEEVAA